MEFHLLVQEISWVQECVMPTLTPTGSAPKPICSPSPLVGKAHKHQQDLFPFIPYPKTHTSHQYWNLEYLIKFLKFILESPTPHPPKTHKHLINTGTPYHISGFVHKQEIKIPGLFKHYLHFFQESFFIDSNSPNTA